MFERNQKPTVEEGEAEKGERKGGRKIKPRCMTREASDEEKEMLMKHAHIVKDDTIRRPGNVESAFTKTWPLVSRAEIQAEFAKRTSAGAGFGKLCCGFTAGLQAQRGLYDKAASWALHQSERCRPIVTMTWKLTNSAQRLMAKPNLEEGQRAHA